MKIADLDDLRSQITALARKSPVGPRVKDVDVEPGVDDTGGDFLRVVVQLSNLEKLTIEDVEPLAQSIEDFVSTVDERFASVRFAEAA